MLYDLASWAADRVEYVLGDVTAFALVLALGAALGLLARGVGRGRGEVA